MSSTESESSSPPFSSSSISSPPFPTSPISPSENVNNNVPSKETATFRNFTAANDRVRTSVEEFYYQQHTKQTYELAGQLLDNYTKLDKLKMGVWEVLELLDGLVDDSDPDTSNSQLQHALQTAEAIRAVYGNNESMDWFPLTGLIHDIGKILSSSVKGFQLPQYLTVGDTFPLGCAFNSHNVFPQYFQENPDFNNSKFNTELGVYTPNIGLDSIRMSFGHDEYLYRVLKGNSQVCLPESSLYMIRFHSFYPWHKHNQYNHLTNEKDRENLDWVLKFNQYDLYSKANKLVDVEKVKPYYINLINKYMPGKLNW